MDYGRDPRGTVTLGVTTTAALMLIGRVVRTCAERYPLVRLSITEGLSEALIDWSRQDRLDLALIFILDVGGDLVVEPVVEESLHLIAPAGRRAPPGQPTPLAAVLDRPLILPSRPHGVRMLVERAAAQIGLTQDQIDTAPLLPSTRMAWLAWDALVSDRHWLEGLVGNTCAERANIPGYGTGTQHKHGWFGLERERWARVFPHLSDDDLEFFEVHEEADVEHSDMSWNAVAEHAAKLSMEDSVVAACRSSQAPATGSISGTGRRRIGSGANTSSRACATPSRSASPWRRPTSCRPNGRPRSSTPQGIDRQG